MYASPRQTYFRHPFWDVSHWHKGIPVCVPEVSSLHTLHILLYSTFLRPLMYRRFSKRAITMYKENLQDNKRQSFKRESRKYTLKLRKIRRKILILCHNLVHLFILWGEKLAQGCVSALTHEEGVAYPGWYWPGWKKLKTNYTNVLTVIRVT